MLLCICIFLSCLHAYASFFLLSCGCLFLFGYFSILLCFVFHIKKNWKIKKIQKQYVFCVHWYCVLWMAIETKFSKLCISCNLDEYLYAHLNEWALWLLFVMSKIELSLILKRVSLFLTRRTKKSWEKTLITISPPCPPIMYDICMFQHS